MQQHGQRGGDAVSRLDHPRAPNAPANAGAGSWTRVLVPRPGAAPMDAAAARHALDGQRRLAENLATLARQQQAALPDESGQTPLPAVAATQALLEDLAGTRTGQAAGQGIGGGEGAAPAWTRPHLLAHGEDGLLALTPQSHVLVSGTDSLLSAGQDLDLTAQGELSLIAAKGIALYTQGTAPATDRPIATTGIALHAATGSLHLQAQQDELRMAAQKAITLASVRGEVNASARQQTLLTAAGAYLKLTPRDIEIGAPGRAEFKAMQRELTGPKTAAFQAETAKSTYTLCEFTALAVTADVKLTP